MGLPVVELRSRIAEAALLTAEDVRAFETSLAAPPVDAEAFAKELVRAKRLTSYQAQALLQNKAKALVLGEYVVLDKLGQGGMGMVLKAEHRRMKRVVALKVLSPNLTRTAAAVARFHREVQAAARLNHPNIVTAHDAGEAKGVHYLVMEYVDGKDLSSLVKSVGPMAVDDAVRCMRQAALGLQYAHENGVVHRDIKPANLLLDKSGHVKILDMGLARIEDADNKGEELTASGQIMGTAEYMSPEQALDTRHADARSDVYSLGCALFYLLTGRSVYGGDTAMKKLLAHRDAPIPSLAEAVAARANAATASVARKEEPGGSRPPLALSNASDSLLRAVDALFRKMVAKSPVDRPQTMAEVVAGLDRCLTQPEIAAAAESESSDSHLHAFLRHMSEEQSLASLSPRTLPPTRGPNPGPGLEEFVQKLPGAQGVAAARPDPATKPTAETQGNRSTQPDRAANAPPDKQSPPDNKKPTGAANELPPKTAAARGASRKKSPAASRTPPWRHDRRVQVGLGGIAVFVVVLAAIGISAFRGRATTNGKTHDDPDGDTARIDVPDGGTVAKTGGNGDEREPRSAGSGPVPTAGAPPLRDLIDLLASPDWEWSPPVNLGPTVNTAAKESHPTLSADGLSLIFTRGDEDRGELFEARRQSPDEPFAAAVSLTILNSSNVRDESPCLSADGLELFFGSRRTTASDVYRSRRTHRDAPWESPVLLGSTVNSNEWDSNPALSPDGRELAIGTFRGGGRGDRDVWIGRRGGVDRNWDSVTNAGPGVNTAEFEGLPRFTPDGNGLLFLRRRNPPREWWGARRDAAGNWQTSSRLDSPFANESPKLLDQYWLSADGRTLTSQVVLPGGHGDLDLWQTRRVPKRNLPRPPASAVAPFDATIARAHQEAWAAHLGEPIETTNSIGMRFVVIPPGKFTMGEAPSVAPFNAVPVELTRPFHLGMHEVTQGQFKTVMDAEPWKGKTDVKEGADHAASYVSWTEATEFCTKLTERERAAGRLRPGDEYRLPTEAEWEWACRAGTTTTYSFGDDAAKLADHAWCDVNAKGVGEAYPHAVGLKKPNPWGLHDVHGNVWEWCRGWSGWPLPGGVDPQGPATGDSRAIRGGSWNGTAEHHKSAARTGRPANLQDFWIGFRVVRTVAVSGGRRLIGTGAAPPAIAPFDAAQAKAHQAAWAKHLGEPVETTNSIGMKFVVIPPGKFTMGEGTDAVPVELTRPFRLGVHEVTQGQFREVTRTEPWKGRKSVVEGDSVAASFVVWTNATDFCRRLTEQERAAGRLAANEEYRLPTAAEWEWACRAGTTTAYAFGDDASKLGDYAWYDANAKNAGEAYAHATGSKRPNAWGLHDMHGNVWEWCGDWHGDKLPGGIDPQGPTSGTFRMNRGGCWGETARNCRSAFRYVNAPDYSWGILGFRVVRTIASRANGSVVAATPPVAVAPFDAATAKAHQAVWAAHLGEPVETTNTIGMKFVAIPPGRFQHDVGGGRSVSVELTRPFHIGRHEVTQSQWQAVTGTAPWKGKTDVREGPDFPATSVNWSDAESFCRTLTERERAAGRLAAGAEYRLPTEAEWEWACRAGAAGPWSFDGDSKQLGEHGWFETNAARGGERYAHAVGQKRPNAWGLFDAHGNVQEWCADWHAAVLPGGTDPRGPADGTRRVDRGGGWGSTAWFCNAGHRGANDPGTRSSVLGFRVVRTIAVPTMPPVAAAAEIDLLALSDAAQDRTYGTWRRTPDGLVGDGEGGTHKLSPPVEIAGDYDLLVTLGPSTGSQATITFPVGTSHATFVFTPRPDGACGTGLELIDKLGWVDPRNPMSVSVPNCRGGDPHDVEIRVRRTGARARIALRLDGRPLSEWEGSPSALSLHPRWRIDQANRLSLGAATEGTTSILFRRVRLRPIGGAAKILRAAANPPADATFFNGKDLTGWNGDPKVWRVEKGELVGVNSDPTAYHRLALTRPMRDFELSCEVLTRVREPKGSVASGLGLRYSGSERASGFLDFLPYRPGTLVRRQGTSWQELTEYPDAVRQSIRPDGYTAFAIRLAGRRATVMVNGVPASDGEHPTLPGDGTICWEMTPSCVELRVRNVRFVDLSGANPPGPWKPLFNGKDLAGWARSNSTDAGAADVVVESGRPALRLTPPIALHGPQLGNHHLRYEFKPSPDSLGGINLFPLGGTYFTFGHDGSFGIDSGTRPATYRTARIQDGRIAPFGEPSNKRMKFADAPTLAPGVWHRIDIVRMDDALAYVVNGRLIGAVADLRVDDQRQTGPLQIRIAASAAGPVLFRNVEVREIDDVPPEIAGLPGSFDAWIAAVRKLPAEAQVEEVKKKLRESNPEFDGTAKSKTADGTVTEFELSTQFVADISPVRALSGLEVLKCIGHPDPLKRGRLKELGPLTGMPLVRLGLDRNPVQDLSPLRGMPLTSLHLPATSVTDLRPLADVPTLQSLDLNSTAVRDLSPLAGLPLRDLHVSSAVVAANRSVLQSIPTLRSMNGKTAAQVLGGTTSKPLFNGRDLAGWKHVSGSVAADWAVEGTHLVNNARPEAQRESHLATADSFREFTFRCEFRLTKGAYGKLILGSAFVDLNDVAHGSDGGESGTIRNLGGTNWLKAKGSVYKAGDWNALAVRREGKSFRVTLNGTVVNDRLDIADAVSKPIAVTQFTKRAELRNLEIEPLPSAEP